jgi:predicted nucleotidyltransferase
MKEETTDPVVTEFGTRVRKALGSRLVAVYWFGSRARGEGRDDSDYDFLVETAVPVTEDERDRVADVSVAISGEQGVALDVHYRDSKRMDRHRGVWTPFLDAVTEEGVRV